MFPTLIVFFLLLEVNILIVFTFCLLLIRIAFVLLLALNNGEPFFLMDFKLSNSFPIILYKLFFLLCEESSAEFKLIIMVMIVYRIAYAYNQMESVTSSLYKRHGISELSGSKKKSMVAKATKIISKDSKRLDILKKCGIIAIAIDLLNRIVKISYWIAGLNTPSYQHIIQLVIYSQN